LKTDRLSFFLWQWSFNLVDDGSSYMIQYLQHGSYMVNDVVVFGPSVVGVATIENTGYLWKVQPSNASYGHV
jgi:hypothetical protein